MALPGIKTTIEDGALGTLPPNTAGASVKMGICSKGTPNTLKGYSDDKILREDLGSGPLVEAIALVLAVAGGPVYACPLTPTTAGTAGVNGTGGGTTHEGTGSGTVAASLAPDRVIIAKVMTGGTLTTAAVSFSVDGGAYSTPVVTGSGPWDYRVPGTLVTLRFPAGTYVLNETYTFNLNGTLTQSGAGPVVTRQATSPVDAYDVVVEIVTDGTQAAGTAAFTYSTDGGTNVSPVIAVPTGAGLYAIPGTGVVLTFAGTFVAGDLYRFTTIAASATTSDVNTAMDFVKTQSVEWDHIHVVGTPTSAANAYTLAVAVDSKMTAMQTDDRFTYAITECPTTESDATLQAAFAPFSSKRVGVAAGDADVVSAITGKTNRRNAAWVVTARIAAIEQQQDPGWVELGGLPNVSKLYRDEAATPGLDEAGRFITLRTHRGLSGFFVTNFRLMAPGGSDFTFGMNRRVMDTACKIARAAELPYISQDVFIAEDGKIDEKDAQRFEADVNSQLKAGVISPGMASASSVVLSRTANILAGEHAPVTVRLRPKGYLRNIDQSIGFTNPNAG